MENLKNSQQGNRNYISLLGNLRDGLFVLVGFVYLVGYLIRSYFAFDYDIGPLPFIDASYIIAGIIPTLLLIIVFLFIRFLLRTPGRIASMKNTSSWWKRLLINVIPPLSIYIFLFVAGWPLYLRGISHFGNEILSIFGPIIIVTYILVYVSHPMSKSIYEDQNGSIERSGYISMFTSSYRKMTSRIYKKIDQKNVPGYINNIVIIFLFPFFVIYIILKILFVDFPNNMYRIYGTVTGKVISVISGIFVTIFVGMICLFAMTFFNLSIYPKIPQEFGGMKPKCAVLDLNINKISIQTSKLFIENFNEQQIEPVMRTSEVLIHYFGNDYIVVSARGREDVTTFKRHILRTEAVSTIVWCEQFNEKYDYVIINWIKSKIK